MHHTQPSLPSRGVAFMTVAHITEMAKIYGGIPLLMSLPGTAAERAGLRWGDVIVSVNGRPTRSLEAFNEARKVRQGSATVRYVRDGAEAVVELVW
jgi:S1-C subfamily serine protease